MKFHIVVSSAKMPSKCWGTYNRIGLIQTDGTVPERIDSRPNFVVSVLKTWENLNVGKTEKCAFRVALKEAKEICEKLNN